MDLEPIAMGMPLDLTYVVVEADAENLTHPSAQRKRRAAKGHNVAHYHWPEARGADFGDKQRRAARALAGAVLASVMARGDPSRTRRRRSAGGTLARGERRQRADGVSAGPPAQQVGPHVGKVPVKRPPGVGRDDGRGLGGRGRRQRLQRGRVVDARCTGAAGRNIECGLCEGLPWVAFDQAVRACGLLSHRACPGRRAC